MLLILTLECTKKLYKANLYHLNKWYKFNYDQIKGGFIKQWMLRTFPDLQIPSRRSVICVTVYTVYKLFVYYLPDPVN